MNLMNNRSYQACEVQQLHHVLKRRHKKWTRLTCLNFQGPEQTHKGLWICPASLCIDAKFGSNDELISEVLLIYNVQGWPLLEFFQRHRIAFEQLVREVSFLLEQKWRPCRNCRQRRLTKVALLKRKQTPLPRTLLQFWTNKLENLPLQIYVSRTKNTQKFNFKSSNSLKCPHKFLSTL